MPRFLFKHAVFWVSSNAVTLGTYFGLHNLWTLPWTQRSQKIIKQAPAFICSSLYMSHMTAAVALDLWYVVFACSRASSPGRALTRSFVLSIVPEEQAQQFKSIEDCNTGHFRLTLPRREQPQDHRTQVGGCHVRTVVPLQSLRTLSRCSTRGLVWRLNTSCMIQVLAKAVTCRLVFGLRLPGCHWTGLGTQTPCPYCAGVYAAGCLPGKSSECHQPKALLGLQIPPIHLMKWQLSDTFQLIRREVQLPVARW